MDNENSYENTGTPAGSVWYDIWTMLKKWVPRLILAFIILKIFALKSDH